MIERLKKDEGYFERLLTEVFLHNEEKTYLVFTPEKGKAQKDAQAFAEKMAERRSAMTDADLRKSKRMLKNWSNSRRRQIHLKFWRRFHYWKFLRLTKSRSLRRIMRIQPQNFCMCRWKQRDSVS